ncbi:MAG: N-acetyl-gamma-glutamyl-phosphate reductase [Phycisphaerales bacterium]|nr:N-acetyl-gamma-glutamyl-phosphate reductase [Phycisphaerales bacterium]
MNARIVIVGAGGYSGAELAEILLGHPSATVVALAASSRREKGDATASRFDELFPRFRGRLELPVVAADAPKIREMKPDCVFLATPHEASLELAAALRDVLVIDLSAAFRLKDASQYPVFYGFEHTEGSLLSQAVYGLPELFRDQIRGASLIAAPGCYPTSAILPLAPLAGAGAVRPGTRPIVDSISGVSGAGRGLSQKSLFCEVSLQAYNVFKHRHQPEIDAYAGCETIFTPHLGAFDRGILSTIHVELSPGWNADRVEKSLREAYGRESFVRLCGAGVWPSVADVRRTNFCDIGWAVDERRSHLIIGSAIDNLTKGAAGQAVQCMNIRLGFPEGAGLGDTRVGIESRRETR